MVGSETTLQRNQPEAQIATGLNWFNIWISKNGSPALLFVQFWKFDISLFQGLAAFIGQHQIQSDWIAKKDRSKREAAQCSGVDPVVLAVRKWSTGRKHEGEVGWAGRLRMHLLRRYDDQVYMMWCMMWWIMWFMKGCDVCYMIICMMGCHPDHHHHHHLF